MISKRTKPSSTDAIIIEARKKGIMRLYIMSSFKAINRTHQPTTFIEHVQRNVQQIKVNKIKLHEYKGQLACNIPQSNHK